MQIHKEKRHQALDASPQCPQISAQHPLECNVGLSHSFSSYKSSCQMKERTETFWNSPRDNVSMNVRIRLTLSIGQSTHTHTHTAQYSKGEGDLLSRWAPCSYPRPTLLPQAHTDRATASYRQSRFILVPDCRWLCKRKRQKQRQINKQWSTYRFHI